MNNTTTSPLHNYVHIPSLRILIAVICIILYLIGYTGCILSIVTFSSKKLRRHSTGFLFLIMALVDIFNLFASLQYFLNVIYGIDVFTLSIHWCRFFTICNYELYFGFSWIFAFISLDRWMKVEWPTKSHSLCTRKRFIILCLIALILSLIQNIIYVFACFDDKCQHKRVFCDIFIHIIYITIYMIVPIAIILISISRTCLITLHLKKRFRTSTPRQILAAKTSKSSIVTNLNSTANSNIISTAVTSRVSTSLMSPPSTTTVVNNTNHYQRQSSQNHLPNYAASARRRRSGLDTQMIILISINVAPFIIVHIITEIAYLFEKYSAFVQQSNVTRLLIVIIYLSWYLISATRFYTNCLLSRIYREEFKNRLFMLRNGCKPRIILVGHGQSYQHSSRYYKRNIINGPENTFVPASNLKSFTET
ncbi:unnamed protein product [Adineta steineri]|uniref:G-protein coupled receptors family 1 profile domain-containing protein n=1 Tax=Adineta steineri TaxID=433720 RepID=A0A814NLX8_9BILA|nr:unnamed protein product [Adineta steineri]